VKRLPDRFESNVNRKYAQNHFDPLLDLRRKLPARREADSPPCEDCSNIQNRAQHWLSGSYPAAAKL
jgi:hypothetical protein